MKQKAEVKFKVSNTEEILKKYNPLVTKLAYQFYGRYHSVLDFNDAKQEVTICLYRCLMKYDKTKSSFVTYFKSAVERMMSRYYYSYFHAVNIAQRTVEVKETDDEDSSKPSFNYLVNKSKETNPRRLRPLLSNKSQRLYDLFMKEGKITRWLIARKLKISRFHAQERYDDFKKELAEVTEQENILI